MSFGIYLGEAKQYGGGYQYAMTMIKALKQIGITCPVLRLPTVPPLWWFWPKSIEDKKRQVAAKLGINLMIYPVVRSEAYELRIPYIIAIHDLAHRHYTNQFPELSTKEAEWRDWLFSRVTTEARAILVDSEISKQDLHDAYAIPFDKIHILPYVPDPIFNKPVSEAQQDFCRKHYHLPDNYVFYPAQFFPHKNHAAIVKALHYLKKQNIQVAAVFSGARKEEYGEYQLTMKKARYLGMENTIRYIGVVPVEHLPALYSMALALVMPTYLGPTNIPPIEAFAVGCPVISSTVMSEQIGDAGLLVSPDDWVGFAENIVNLKNDANLRASLVECGHKKNLSWTTVDYAESLYKVIRNAIKI